MQDYVLHINCQWEMPTLLSSSGIDMHNECYCMCMCKCKHFVFLGCYNSNPAFYYKITNAVCLGVVGGVTDAYHMAVFSVEYNEFRLLFLHSQTDLRSQKYYFCIQFWQ